MPSVEIVPAGKSDVRFLAWVVLAAGRSHTGVSAWDLMVPESEEERLRFIETLLVAQPSWCHHEAFRIARVDGEPAAALSGYSLDGTGLSPPEEILPAVARASGWSEARLAGAFARMAPFVGCLLEDHPEAWAIEWVATAPGHRRLGLVQRLLDDRLEAGRAKGHPVAQLLLYIDNEPAQRAYEKAGFRIVDERRDARFEEVVGAPGIARMECPL